MDVGIDLGSIFGSGFGVDVGLSWGRCGGDDGKGLVLHDKIEPAVCDFETDWCSWTTVSGSKAWARKSGSTSSSGTGPDSAHGGSYYVYMETSSPNHPNVEFAMESSVPGEGTLCKRPPGPSRGGPSAPQGPPLLFGKLVPATPESSTFN